MFPEAAATWRGVLTNGIEYWNPILLSKELCSYIYRDDYKKGKAIF